MGCASLRLIRLFFLSLTTEWSDIQPPRRTVARHTIRSYSRIRDLTDLHYKIRDQPSHATRAITAAPSIPPFPKSRDAPLRSVPRKDGDFRCGPAFRIETAAGADSLAKCGPRPCIAATARDSVSRVESVLAPTSAVGVISTAFRGNCQLRETQCRISFFSWLVSA
jgi:hypothetical protein